MAVARRAPHAIVCGLNAAAIHDLTDEIPRAVQIAVALGSTPPRIDYPPVQVFRFKPSTFELGLTSFEAASEDWVGVCDRARTVVDLIRLRHRFGSRSPTRHSTRPAQAGRPAAPLRTYVSQLGAERAVRAALDLIVSS